MPNHTSNRLLVTADAETLESIFTAHFDATGTLDLNTIVPMPDAVRNSTSGSGSHQAQKLLSEGVPVESLLESPETDEPVKAALRLYQDFGYVSWYEWALANWGTKWNCYEGSVDVVAGSLEALFQSAWCPPLPAIAALSGRYPDAVFCLDALDEGGGFAVTDTFRGGRRVLCRSWDWAEMASEVFCMDVSDEEDGETDDKPDAPENRGYRNIRLS